MEPRLNKTLWGGGVGWGVAASEVRSALGQGCEGSRGSVPENVLVKPIRGYARPPATPPAAGPLAERRMGALVALGAWVQ